MDKEMNQKKADKRKNRVQKINIRS